jgi:ankyrin repeat protein
MLTPLHAAALQGHADVVQLLCKRPRVDVKATEAHGRTPLSCTVFNGHCDASKTLLKAKGRGVDVNTADKKRFTPLVRAAWRGDIEIIKVLIMDMDVDINKEGPGGRNALHWTAHQGDYKIITALLKLGKRLNINAEDDGKHTVLQLAVFNAYSEVVQMLLKFPRIDANCRDILDWMPLTYSVSEQNLELIQILLKEAPGLNVNSADYEGRNALIFASAEGFDASVSLRQKASTSTNLMTTMQHLSTTPSEKTALNPSKRFSRAN